MTAIFPRSLAKAILHEWWDNYGLDILLRGKVQDPLKALEDYVTKALIHTANATLDID